MKRWNSTLLSSLALAATLSVAGAAPTTAHAGEPPAARAAELYRQATRLYAARKLAEAEPLYQQAWALQKSYDIASNLGALMLELGKPRQAAELLTHALDQFPVRGRAEERAALEERLAEAKRRVVTLRVKLDVTAAELRIDGQLVGRAPLPAEIFVEPGPRMLEARAPGHVDMRLPIRAAAGAKLDVRLPLSPPLPPPRRSAAPVIAGGVIGATAAGVGIAMIVVAEVAKNRAASLHDTIYAAGASCAASAPGCADLRAATARADRFGNAGLALLGVAGAAAAATVGYVLWPSTKRGDARVSGVRMSLTAGPAGGGALITGSF